MSLTLPLRHLDSAAGITVPVLCIKLVHRSNSLQLSFWSTSTAEALSPATTMTPLQENVAISVTQDTELVFINSSPIQLACLPKPRVIKRKDNHFMLRCSPTSPTLGIRRKVGSERTSGMSKKQAARSKGDYASTNGT